MSQTSQDRFVSPCWELFVLPTQGYNLGNTNAHTRTHTHTPTNTHIHTNTHHKHMHAHRHLQTRTDTHLNTHTQQKFSPVKPQTHIPIYPQTRRQTYTLRKSPVPPPKPRTIEQRGAGPGVSFRRVTTCYCQPVAATVANM